VKKGGTPIAAETHNANVEVAASVEKALKKLKAEEHDFVKFRAVAAIIKKPG